MTGFELFVERISSGGIYDPVSWAVVCWLFAFGACAGSFMNVVIWRLPLGRSLTFPGSRCPNCGHGVRARDNVPILNWFLLRGRCRDCRVRISGRYPAVEALVAALFVIVALVEPLAEGSNLPRPLVSVADEPTMLLRLWTLYALQMLLLCTLFCAAFIWFDGNRPPERLYAPLALTALLLTLYLPELRAEQLVEQLGHLPPRFAVASESVLGMVLAAGIGLLTARAMYRYSDRPPVVPAVWETVVCGLVSGIPAMVRIVALAAGLFLMATVLGRRVKSAAYIPWTAFLVVASLLHIAYWKPLSRAGVSLGIAPAGLATLGLALATIAGLGITIELLRRGQPVRTAGWNRDWPITRSPHIVNPQRHSASVEAILNSASYKLAELDTDFLQRDELRPVRMQLELLKPEMTLAEHRIESTIVAFGGTQIVEQDEAVRRLELARQALATSPHDTQLQRAVERCERLLAKAHYYQAAREFARIVSSTCQSKGHCGFVIVTGGGPGIMEAANRGAFDVGAKSIGLNITLPQEQTPNGYITPELCFQFHYFALRKMHFMLRARALVVFPGGFGTLDELFEVLTLRQTNRMQQIPVILYGRAYWERAINFQYLADEGVIADEHLKLIEYAETPQEAWDIISRFHRL